MEEKRFLSFKDMKRKDYRKNAIIGLLGGFILNMGSITVMPEVNLILAIIGSVLGVAGLICGFIWLYKTIRKEE